MCASAGSRSEDTAGRPARVKITHLVARPHHGRNGALKIAFVGN